MLKKMKRTQSPRSTDSLVSSALKSLINEHFSLRSTTFCHGAFKATLHWKESIQTVDCCLEELKECTSGHNLDDVIILMIQKINDYVNSHPIFTSAKVRVFRRFYLNRVPSYQVVWYPMGWIRLCSSKADIYQLGLLAIHVEFRAIDLKTHPTDVIEIWNGHLTLPNNSATVLNLKDAIDELRDSDKSFVEEGPIVKDIFDFRRYKIKPLPKSLAVFSIQSYYKENVKCDENTPWMAALKDLDYYNCQSSGIMRVVAFVVDENSEEPLK
jgi:hypothetical protein